MLFGSSDMNIKKKKINHRVSSENAKIKFQSNACLIYHIFNVNPGFFYMVLLDIHCSKVPVFHS